MPLRSNLRYCVTAAVCQRRGQGRAGQDADRTNPEPGDIFGLLAQDTEDRQQEHGRRSER